MVYPSVFILVLNYNGKEDTLECLRSLQEVTYPNRQVVVLDNASEDGTAESVGREFSDVRVIRNPLNLGFAEGNNVGMAYAMEKGADYVFLLNNDTVVDPEVLNKLVQAAEGDPRVGMVGPVIYRYDRPAEIWSSGGRIFWPLGTARQISKPPAGFTEVDFLSGCALMVKCSAIDRVGLLDPEFFLYYEDVDWSRRFERAGFRVVLVPTAAVWHKEMRSVGQRSRAHEYYVSRNNLLLMQKHLPWWLWTTFWPAFVLKVALKASWFAVGGRFHLLPALFAGIRDFFAGRRGKRSA